MILLARGTDCADLSTPQRPQGLGKVVNQGLTCTDATVETMQSVPDVLVSLAEGPPGRADLARRRAITLQAGSHKGGPGTRSGPLLAIAAAQAVRNGLCRPPESNPRPIQMNRHTAAHRWNAAGGSESDLMRL